MFTSTDYDKLEQLMAESPENRALIQKLLKSQEETIASVSHEIRNPLTLVYSTLQLIESNCPEVTSCRYWDSMRNDIEYMKQLLEELSSFNHGTSLFLSSFSFREFMERLVLSFASFCADTSIEFISRLSSNLPEIQADHIKLQEVFLNLLKNAFEAIEGPGTIYLNAYFQAPYIRVDIQDSGCGISPASLENIFQPFVTYKSSGTGLGLAIVKRTVEAHHGTVSVQSSSEHGTVFTVLLPMFPVQENGQ